MIRKIFLSAGMQLLLAASLAFSQTVWQKYEGNPVLVRTEGWENAFGVIGPRVLKIDDLYKMWYIGLGLTRQVGLATSVDGIHWTKSAANPLFSRGQPGDFDSDIIYYGSVLFHDNQYWLWYSGHNYSTERWQIGLATSPDGIHWTKHPENPVLTVGFSWQWDASGVSTPAVIFDGHSFKMWYNGSGTQQAVGYAESSDGVHWTKYPQNPILAPIPTSTWESQAVGMGTVLLFGRKFHAWYSGSKDGISRIGYATSADGITWERFADNPVLGPGGNNAWDSSMPSGFCVLHENNALKMWYSGRNSSEIWTIGYAESKDNSSDDYALSFDGRNDVVGLPSNLISTPAAITLEAWVKYSSNKVDMMALSLEDAYGFHLNRFGTGTFTPFFDGAAANGNDLGYGAKLNDNQWHHLAAVHAQGTTKIFVDGDSVGSVKESLYDINALNRASAIGAQFDGAGSHFDGLIDEVRVWNVARTPDEIQEYMHLRLAGNESGLIGYWPGDEGDGQILHDASPSGKHGQRGLSPNDDVADPHWVLANTGCQGIPLPAFEAYGNISGGDRFHPDKVTYCFNGQAGDWYLSFQAYDIDTNQEAYILLNGVKLSAVPLTANNSWSGLLGVLLPDELIHDDDNELIFENTKNPPQSLLWGVRQVSIVPFFALPSAAAYGKIPGGDQTHADKVVYLFSGRPGDLNLIYEVYDIDNVNELEVSLNGAQIHDETPTADNAWSKPRTLHLPDALVNDAGLNVLIFDSPSNPPQQWYWGVRNVRVEIAPQASIALNLSQSLIAEANKARDGQYLFDGRITPPARLETDDSAVIDGATTIAPNGDLVIDFQSVRQFDYLQLYPEWNAQRYYAYHIEASQNGKDWQTVIDKSASFVHGIQLEELPITQARFLRIRGASFMADMDTLAAGSSEEAYWQTHDDLINRADSTDLAIAELALFQKQLQVNVAHEPNSLPASFDLAQNFPNPVSQIPRFAGNPATTIKFALPRPAKVKLAVYDLRGALVRILEEGELPAGFHARTFDTAGLASGIYLYQLQAGDFTATRKMVLAK